MLSRRNMLGKLGMGLLAAPLVGIATASVNGQEPVALVPEKRRGLRYEKDCDRPQFIAPSTNPKEVSETLVKALKEEALIWAEFYTQREVKRLQLKYNQDDELLEGQKFSHFNKFNSDTPVSNGDSLTANHSVAITYEDGVKRTRRFDVYRSLTVIGVCVEGLVIRDNGKLRLATSEEVSIEEDTHKDIKPEAWMEEIAEMVKEHLGRQHVTNTA